MGAGKVKAYVSMYVHEEVNAHLWSLTLTPSQQPSVWEVQLGDQRPSLRPRELRVSSGASSESELDSTGVILIFFVDVGFLGDAAFDFGFSSSPFWLLFFIALSGDFPSSTFFFTRARASPFVVFRMLEVLSLISPSLPSRVTRLTSFFLYLTSSTRTTSESSFSSSMSIFCSSSLSSLERDSFAAAFPLALGFVKGGVAATGIFVDEKLVARDFVSFFSGSQPPPLMPLGH